MHARTHARTHACARTRTHVTFPRMHTPVQQYWKDANMKTRQHMDAVCRKADQPAPRRVLSLTRDAQEPREPIHFGKAAADAEFVRPSIGLGFWTDVTEMLIFVVDRRPVLCEAPRAIMGDMMNKILPIKSRKYTLGALKAPSLPHPLRRCILFAAEVCLESAGPCRCGICHCSTAPRPRCPFD